MLTRMRFKNWRSLKDVEISDLTPITVFIGANSSGKTNIIDALYFLRESSEEGALSAVQNRGGEAKVHTVGIDTKQPIEVEFSFKSSAHDSEHSYMLGLEYKQPVVPNVAERLTNQDGEVFLDASYEGVMQVRNEYSGELIALAALQEAPLGWERTLLSVYGGLPSYSDIYQTFQYITQRWQLLSENFMPSETVSFGAGGDLTVIDPCADNMAMMLDFMSKVESNLHSQLQEDFRWLVEHVEQFSIESNEREVRYSVTEKTLGGQTSPTISAGTARLLAMLTAYYALDMRKAEMPGLVVIEEPDTALNPGLLRNFVEQLRNYTSREGYPRQFILTTHNPHFLDYFEPEEVRVVERDEHGYTQVKRIPDYIGEIWLKDNKYGLGEVWMTNSFGGLPE